MKIKCGYKPLKLIKCSVYSCAVYSKAQVIAAINYEDINKGLTVLGDKSLELSTDEGELLFDGVIDRVSFIKEEDTVLLALNAAVDICDIKAIENTSYKGSRGEIDLNKCCYTKLSGSRGYEIMGTKPMMLGDTVSIQGKTYCVTQLYLEYEGNNSTCDCRIEAIE